MRTNIVIDDEVMREAANARPKSTKRALVEEGLRLVAGLGRQRKLRQVRGKLKWSGDLDVLRTDAK
jgi:Arc/MetJ family transcription regulator